MKNKYHRTKKGTARKCPYELFTLKTANSLTVRDAEFSHGIVNNSSICIVHAIAGNVPNSLCREIEASL